MEHIYALRFTLKTFIVNDVCSCFESDLRSFRLAALFTSPSNVFNFKWNQSHPIATASLIKPKKKIILSFHVIISQIYMRGQPLERDKEQLSEN